MTLENATNVQNACIAVRFAWLMPCNTDVQDNFVFGNWCIVQPYLRPPYNKDHVRIRTTALPKRPIAAPLKFLRQFLGSLNIERIQCMAKILIFLSLSELKQIFLALQLGEARKPLLFFGKCTQTIFYSFCRASCLILLYFRQDDPIGALRCLPIWLAGPCYGSWYGVLVRYRPK